jgi:hypothetical protein
MDLNVPCGSDNSERATGSHVEFTATFCRGQENVGLYIHSSSLLHGVPLNYLRTGATSSSKGRTEQTAKHLFSSVLHYVHLLQDIFWDVTPCWLL